MKDDIRSQKGGTNRDFSQDKVTNREPGEDNATNRDAQADLVGENEGEGSRTAARRYNEATEKSAHSGNVREKAREAADALDSEEGSELREAEQIGKKGPQKISSR